MAIIDLFECQVLTDGEAVKEDRYKDEDDEDISYPEGTKVAMRYIEAVPGAKFALKIHAMRGYNFNDAEYLCVQFILVGQVQDDEVVEKSIYSRSKGYSFTKFDAESKNSTGHTIRKFQFGEIVTRELSPSDTNENLESRYGQLGTIKIEFWRGVPYSDVSNARSSPEPEVAEAVPEKVRIKRALTLKASEAEATEPRDLFYIRELDADPVAVFRFKYRSQKSLRELLVIPRTPSPVPLEERPIEELSIEELRELTRRQKALVEAAGLRVKEEKDLSKPQSLHAAKMIPGHVKRGGDQEGEAGPTGSAQKKQKRSDVEIEVIDLLD